MVVHKRKKSRRLRGSREMGYGRHHRGSGNTAGKGNAAGGKKAHAKKSSFREVIRGRHGFTPPSFRVDAITLKDIEQQLMKWKEEGAAKEADGVFDIDLDDLGFDKVLGTGKVKHKLRLKINSATARATEKLKAAGGEIVQ